MVQRRNRKMQIFVDADACPVVAIIEKIAKDNSVPVMLLCDTNHVLSSTYSKVVVVGAGADAVDYKLISICHKGDIVVSQDYGVAAMALGKGAYAIHQSGKWYTDDNIDQMLMERHLSKKARRSSHKNHIKGPKKRTEEDNIRFAQSFEKMLMMVQEAVFKMARLSFVPFGDKIRKLRKEKKMTQQKLGDMVGVSHRTIRSWEVEGRYPKQSSLYQKLADAFQCQVSYLMNDNETVCLGNDEPSEYAGAKQARQILEQVAALFASGTMTNEDKTIFMDEMTRLYLASKKNRRKW